MIMSLHQMIIIILMKELQKKIKNKKIRNIIIILMIKYLPIKIYNYCINKEMKC